MDSTVLSIHGLRWRLRPGAEAIVRGLDLERLRRPDVLAPDELVKDSTVRTVARLADPVTPTGPCVYVKRLKFRGLRERLRHMIVPTKMDVEWRMSRALQAAGIATCDVLAVGVRRIVGVPREGFIVVRELPGTTSLREWLAAHPEERASMIEPLADVTARLLDAGFYHCDYHAGNILVDADGGLHVVDLHSVRRRRVSRRHALAMLAMLDNSTRAAGVTCAERVEFLRAFLERWRSGPGVQGLAQWTTWAADARARLHRRHMASRTRRCLKRSTEFTPDRAGVLRIHRRRDFPADAALAVVREHGEVMKAGTDDGLRDGRRTQVSLCRTDAVPTGRVCVKAYIRPTFAAQVKDVLRLRGRARAAWIASRGCHVRGVAVARSLALLESRFGPADYLITEAVPCAGDLDAVACAGIPPGVQRRELAQAIAQMLGSLADERVRHPDTKPTNLLVQWSGDEARMVIVDLDRVRFDVPITQAEWVRMLAQVNAGLPGDVTVRDRLRCLRACARGRWDAPTRRRIARAVLNLSLTRNPMWLRP